jgi:AmmeMemoRadiSam system protein A
MQNKSQWSQEDKNFLLLLARKSIAYFLENNKIPRMNDLDIKCGEAFQQNFATFVTLRIQRDLRGCIGELRATKPLFESVIHNAIQSAFHDFRFSKLTKEEFNDIDIKISILTNPTPACLEEIRLGDGIILEKKGRSAVFLPEVAQEQGWDMEQTLTHLCLKAGLSSHDWKTNTKFWIFQSIAFGEKD